MSAEGFSRLDPGLPLTLFPVRLEARYLPRRQPTHLLIRVFPDVIHADGHGRWLSEREAEAGRHYWTSIWGSTDPASITEARRWLAAQTGPHRALWVATTWLPSSIVEDVDPNGHPLFAGGPHASEALRGRLRAWMFLASP